MSSQSWPIIPLAIRSEHGAVHQRPSLRCHNFDFSMSCVLVGLSTLKIHPNKLSAQALAYLVSRDIMLLAWHIVLVLLAPKEPKQECISESNVYSWLLFDIAVSVIRLAKNPLQYAANRAIQNNGANWQNPEDQGNSWVYFLSPQYGCCQMRLYTFLDWLTYLSWILGAWAVHPVVIKVN